MCSLLRVAMALVCVALPITSSVDLRGSQATPAAQSDRERFVGAWRLAWMEEPGPDGKIIRRTNRKGSLMYTRDGRMSVQIQFPESQSSVSNDYISNGYEASFGTYEVNGQAHTITRHVEGSITRGLVGQSLTRAYPFSDVGPDDAIRATGGTLVDHVGTLLRAGADSGEHDEETHTR